MFANFIGQNFFPPSDKTFTLFTIFCISTIGNVIRILGATIIGFLGDTLSKKNVFTNTLLYMAIATFLIGILPKFQYIGILSTVFFGILRVIQGITFGAEIPGAMTLLTEHIYIHKHRGFYFGLMSSITGFGIILCAFITWIITLLLSEQQINNWGFRIPFLIGSIGILFGVIIRRYLFENHNFLKKRNGENIISKKFEKRKYDIVQIFTAIGILIFPACFISMQMVFPVYLHEFYHLPLDNIYFAVLIGHVLSTFIIPLFGLLSDFMGSNKYLLILAEILATILLYPILHLSIINNWNTAIIFYVFSQFITSIFTASYYALLPQAFESSIRFTCTTFAYNIAFFIASFVPICMNYIFNVEKNPNFIILLLACLSMISVFSTIFLKVHDVHID